jgi:S1-C subfamily serine protease
MSSVTMGIVSAVGRTGGPAGNINDFIQTDTSINSGNSGGALVNIRGEVIGINTWIASNSSSGGSVGLGFAIPINNTKRAIDDFIKSGDVNDGWLGVSLTDPDRDMLQALGVDGTRGAFASQVFSGSPADKGGIRPGDYITHVDGREVRGMTALTQMVGDTRPGETVVFTVIRDGAPGTFSVKIETRTDDVAADNKKLWPGIMVIPLTDAVRASLRLPGSAQGLYAASVISESPAAVIGMQRGDRITAVNDTPVKDLASFYKVLRENTGRELWFTFIRGETTLDSLRYKR